MDCFALRPTGHHLEAIGRRGVKQNWNKERSPHLGQFHPSIPLADWRHEFQTTLPSQLSLMFMH